MATCPSCGASSRVDPTFQITEAFAAKPLGSYSVSGIQAKAVVTRSLVLTHSCGWSVAGHIEDDQFVADFRHSLCQTYGVPHEPDDTGWCPVCETQVNR